MSRYKKGLNEIFSQKAHPKGVGLFEKFNRLKFIYLPSLPLCRLQGQLLA
ncbi:MAG: hypothetical protein BWY23_00650 [Spirochaetes bacterium ADurb.Bin218]|nr:MAG: hypothetical protein BWY23_00650 [Spirochaetes bacterium ADurb.Bin218]